MLRIPQILLIAFLLGNAPAASPQSIPRDVKDKIDGIISSAYKVAASGFPCKIGTSGKLHMARWQRVDRCLNDAAGRVDWVGISKQLEMARAEALRVTSSEFAAAMDSSLLAHALPFQDVFNIKNEKALLPLTNSLLRFLPPDSLHDLPVTDRAGKQVGTFTGIYSFERSGGLSSANTYRLTLFQYTDVRGNVVSTADKLLLDAYGVPWPSARSQPGFLLPADRIVLKR